MCFKPLASKSLLIQNIINLNGGTEGIRGGVLISAQASWEDAARRTTIAATTFVVRAPVVGFAWN
jgi:hypothetical protein